LTKKKRREKKGRDEFDNSTPVQPGDKRGKGKKEGRKTRNGN